MSFLFDDLSLFDKGNKIYKGKVTKFYEFQHKKDKKKYIAEMTKAKWYSTGRDYRIDISREINVMIKLNHPTILQIIGYGTKSSKNHTNSIIITDYVPNNTLFQLLEIENQNHIISEWDDNKKLINIYGIASGMSYLHSNEIIHCSLQPGHIFLDEFYNPKIGGFCSSKKISGPKFSEYKQTGIYVAPEVYMHLDYSKSSDVYSFAFIIYQIISNEKPFKEFSDDIEIMKAAAYSNNRPEINHSIPECYRKLIEKCWSSDPYERPTFDDIVIELETNSEFITEKVDKDVYFNYIQSIKKSKISFNDEIVFDKFDRSIQRYSDYKINDLYKAKPIVIHPNENLDLTKFELDELQFPNEENFYKIFEVSEIETSKQFTLKIPIYDIKYLFRTDVINFVNEMSIIIKLNHPSILRTIGYSPIGFSEHQKHVIITEKLSHNIRSFFEPLPEQYAKYKKDSDRMDDTQKLICIYCIAAGMAYLHEHNIIHRNLKAENILLDENHLPKITGFELARYITDLNEKDDKIQGTPAYIAPEIYLYQEYSFKSDVYAFSLVMYEIMTEQKPYEDITSITKLFHIVVEEGLRPAFYSKPVLYAYRLLVNRCWSQDPEMRPTFTEIMNELKTNPDFITENVDKEYFLAYAHYIDKYPNSFDSNKIIEELDAIKMRINTILDVNTNFTIGTIFDTETNNISFDCEYLNNNNYIIQDKYTKKIRSLDFYEIYEKETMNKYFCKRFPDREKLFKFNLVNLMNEFNVTRQLNHPAILKLIGYSPFDFNNYSNMVLIYEHAKNECNLDDPNIWTETRKLICIYGIAAGMAYLHKHNIIHRNLKLENILLTNNLLPKITGFSISLEIQGETVITSDKKGTPAYLAPEVYLNQEYGFKSDVYAFSYLTYEIMTNKKPFNAKMYIPELIKKVVEEGMRPTFDKPIPNAYRQLIERCWSQDANSRPTFSEIMNELKTNSEFITENVKLSKFVEYVKMIDDSKITFESDKKIDQLDEYLYSKCSILPDYEFDVISSGIYNTEFNNLYYDNSIFDKSKYKRIPKACNLYLDETTGMKITNKYEEVTELSLEINMYKKIKSHPAIIKYFGYQIIRKNFDIFIEYASNGSLKQILDNERKGNLTNGWNDTKKLINIYGIASALSYLHSIGIVYVNLNPKNIYLDDFLYPKLSDFKESYFLSSSTYIKKEKYTIGDDYNYLYIPIYNDLPTKVSDVLLYSLIVYSILFNEYPYKYDDSCENPYKSALYDRACYRNIEYRKPIAECYKKLINSCNSKKVDERPSFDEIVYELRTNPEFILENADKEEFFKYIKHIDEFYLNANMNNQNFTKIKIEIPQQKIAPKLDFTINIESINLDKYNKIEKIGQGGFGAVYTVMKKETNEIYAAKISLDEMDASEKDLIKKLSREIDIISQLNYPSILQYIGYNPRNFKLKPKPTIITEYALNKSLDKIIKLESLSHSIPDWNDTKKLINIYGIAAGMSYLHKKNILHRDLKPENIFLDEFLYPKIGDFGLSKKMTDNSISDSTTNPSGYKGTRAYSAPEVLKDYLYSKSGDVYSYGMIVYEIMMVEFPFKSLNQFQFYTMILNGFSPEFKNSIPKCYQDLIKKCLSVKRDMRPSFDSIKNMIEKNSEFITEKVDKKEFLNYVLYINEKEKHFDSLCHKVSVDITTHEDIQNDIQLNELFLNLSEYEKQEMISKRDNSKLYKVVHTKTKEFYQANISSTTMKRIKGDEIVSLDKEVKSILNLFHPSLLKVIGYSPFNFSNQQRPVVLTEMPQNGSIADILKMEKRYIQVNGWNETKKLINIYGIASLMSYLHSHDIIHRDLRPENIFLDEYLFPKVGYFDLLTRFNNRIDLSFQSIAKIKDLPIYSAPEVLESDDYSKSSDVYAFAFIVYDIMYKENLFRNYSSNKLFIEVVKNGKRPEIKKSIPNCYRKLIKKCWSQNASDRPTFDQIVAYLKTESEFVTAMVNKSDYFVYVKYLDEFKSNDQIKFIDFIKSEVKIDDIEDDNESLNDIKAIFESEEEDKIEKTDNEDHSSSENDDEFKFEERIKIIETE